MKAELLAIHSTILTSWKKVNAARAAKREIEGLKRERVCINNIERNADGAD